MLCYPTEVAMEALGMHVHVHVYASVLDVYA